MATRALWEKASTFTILDLNFGTRWWYLVKPRPHVKIMKTGTGSTVVASLGFFVYAETQIAIPRKRKVAFGVSNTFHLNMFFVACFIATALFDA